MRKKRPAYEPHEEWMIQALKRIFKEVTLTALVHHLPRAVLKALPEYDFEPAGKGIFCRRSHPVSYVIVLKEVPDELLPEELQAFSTRERRLRIVLAALQKREKPPILEAMFNLYESEVDQIMMTREAMAKKLVKIAGPTKVSAALDKKYHLQALDKKDLMQALDKKDHMQALDKKDHLRALSQEDIIAAVLRNKRLLKTLEAKLKLEQRRKMSGETGPN